MKLEWTSHEDEGYVWYSLEIPQFAFLDLCPPEGDWSKYRCMIYFEGQDNPKHAATHEDPDIDLALAKYWAEGVLADFLFQERNKIADVLNAVRQMHNLGAPL